MICYYSCCFVD